MEQNLIHKLNFLIEAAYVGNIGFVEMMQFYDKATPKEIKLMEKLIKKNDWQAYKDLIQSVTGVELK